MWLTEYHTVVALPQKFGISLRNVCDTIYTILPILYEHCASRYITLNDEKLGKTNEFREFPNAVGAIEAFALQINRAQGDAQRMYYRRDRRYHFLNFGAVVDNDGLF